MWNKKKIRFTDKKHSRQGIISSGLGGAALLLFAASVAAAYIRSGQAGRIIAVTGFLAMLCACAGLYYGIMGYRRKELTGYFRGWAADEFPAAGRFCIDLHFRMVTTWKKEKI